MSDELKLSIDRALSQRRLAVENKNLKQQLDERFGIDSIIGHDYRMLQVYDVIESVADSRTTVLITGESGTGKTMIARAIHRRSARRDNPFIEVACGALPETLLESELFGHRAGSFTGAVRDKAGKFASADSGTIFLDEIATASPALQVKLLRVLQDMEFEQVGGTETIRVDARVILATNQDLAELVAERQFRQDLYYRINVVAIHLPPLRERISDIPLLCKHFVDKYGAQCERKVLGFTEQAMDLMQRYQWPGNIRELENVVERAIVLGKGEWIQVSDLPSPLHRQGLELLAAGEKGNLKAALKDPERRLILEALEAHNWNRQETADALGINRTTLYKKMKRYGIGGEDEHTPLRIVKW
jgi:DNA-binding NtrC family response regulator